MTTKIILIIILIIVVFIGIRVLLLEKRILTIENNTNDLKVLNSLRTPIELPMKAVEITKEIYAIVECESQWDDDIYGDLGKSYGYVQFHKPTFEWLSKLAGEKLDYYNPNHQLWLLKWALDHNYGRLWTCYRNLTKLN